MSSSYRSDPADVLDTLLRNNAEDLFSDVSDEFIQKDKIQHIVDALCQLSEANLMCFGLGPRGLKVFCEALSTCATQSRVLHSVYLKNNGLRLSDHTEDLCSAFHSFASLRHLDLSGNNLSCGNNAPNNTIMLPPNLTFLSVASCEVGPSDVAAMLVPMLTSLTGGCLEHLQIQGNPLGSEGAVHLFSALPKCTPNLVELNVSNCRISDLTSVLALFDEGMMPNFTTLQLQGNDNTALGRSFQAVMVSYGWEAIENTLFGPGEFRRKATTVKKQQHQSTQPQPQHSSAPHVVSVDVSVLHALQDTVRLLARQQQDMISEILYLRDEVDKLKNKNA
eukprot:PhM_4_TR10371/c0_g1_i2/m.83971